KYAGARAAPSIRSVRIESPRRRRIPAINSPKARRTRPVKSFGPARLGRRPLRWTSLPSLAMAGPNPEARSRMPTRPIVVVTRKLPDPIETRMMELFDVRLNLADSPMSQGQLIAAVKTCDVLVPTVTDRIDAAVLSQAGERLRLIASFGTGVDHIDLKTARQRNVTVTNTPGVLTEDTADMTMALILAVPRRLTEGERLMRSATWAGWSPTSMLGKRIWGKRLGIIGMGRIGSAVARRARGFGLAVHYHNRRRVHPSVEAELEATYWESLDQMLARMDII